jgi:response regulator of citrate/malate metabolism
MEQQTKQETMEVVSKISEKNETSADLTQLLNYLQTENGSKLANRLVDIFAESKHTVVTSSWSQARWEKWLQGGVIFLVVVATATLTYFDKFDTSVGVLFGTLVGYVFGKK